MDAQFTAIAHEAGIAASHIGAGVTSLQHANHAHRAYYYQSFFALSVGFERSAKLALVIHHALTHGTFPPSADLRRYGHDLTTLLEHVDNVAVSNGLSGPDDRLPRHSVHAAIISVLSEFASNVTRYYNLDFLTSSPHTAPNDAVTDWFNRVLVQVKALHYPERVRLRHESRAATLEALVGGHASVMHTTETGIPIRSITDATTHGLAVDHIKPYTRMYVLQIARFLARLMNTFSHATYGPRQQRIPDLNDFYRWYDTDDRFFRSKKVWSIH